MSSEQQGSKYRRILTMDRAEIADRIRQQARALIDLLRYKAGADLAPRLRAASEAPKPRFFFSPEEVPEICSRLRTQFPEIARQIVERADRICAHRFDLLGFEDVDYGPEIDWHCDRVHGKRAARVPWFQVKYLDFAEVGDSKVTWELNRHQHLVTLAKAYRLTGNEKFAAELFSQWHHWHGENPYPIGINWASSLEVAFRSLSWLWLYFLMEDSPAMPSSFRAEWLRALAISGRHIDSYLSTYFSPNTHLLGEAVALFFIGTLCPEIPAAQRWQERGGKIVLQEAHRQMQSDGLHFEQSIYYHVYAVDFCLHSAVLASLNQIEAPAGDRTMLDRPTNDQPECDQPKLDQSNIDRPMLHQTIELMLDALAIVARGGSVPRLGDDDGGRLFDASRNRSEHLLDPLATGAVLFERGDFKTLACGPREETLWLLGTAGMDEFERLPAAPRASNSIAMNASGLYVMSSDAGRKLVIDAGPQGAHTAGHGHADALSITASVAGHDLLIDCGTLEYVGASGDRDRFRGTAAHNTLVVAGQDQAEPHGPFSWGRLPRVTAEGWIAGKTFDLFVGSHDGYTRLPNPVIHRRFVFALKSGFGLVRDLALGLGEYPLDLYWHLAPGLANSAENSLSQNDHNGLRFVTVEGHGWKQSVEEHPHSPEYGCKETHRVLHFATVAKLPVEFLTVLLPGSAASHSQPEPTRIAAPAAVGGVVGYHYKSGVDAHDIFFGQHKGWSLGEWSSDAEFLFYAEREDSTLLICCNATYVKWSGRAIVTASEPVLRCEVIQAGTQFEVVTPNPESVTVDREAWSSLRTNSRVEFAGHLNFPETDQKENL